MLTVGCAGFAVPATRYFKEYLFVEVQETHVAIPGPGTVRRWRREAPEGFEFAVLGPKQVGLDGFRSGAELDAALQVLVDVAADLNAKTAVFVAPPDFTNTRTNKSALKDFLKAARARFDTVVFEGGPAWKADDLDKLAAETDTLAVRDPLHQGLSKREVAYYRLPGPAGRKSRYEDPAIERLAEIAQEDLSQNATYVFANVDMFADAKRFKKAMGLPTNG
ncbi:MAG: DUF72 domain-containing protein [Polyangiaceae bacterium]|nr:DUF72 domain-containing protein [Polyangiaceae bacterium]